jgi:hypothetical protein
MKGNLKELRSLYAPYAKELEELMVRRKLGLATISKAKNILFRAFGKALEKGFDEGMAWQINKTTKEEENGKLVQKEK